MYSVPDYNFLYVAITRTGSEAVRSGLAQSHIGRSGTPYGTKEQPSPEIPWLHTGHYTASEWKTVLGEEDFNNRFKFTIVRSPWCKLVSHYTGACKYKQFGLLKSDRGRPERFNLWLKKVLTEHWVAKCSPKYGPRAKDCDHERTPHWNCLDWITDDDGNIMVDYIGRHEDQPEAYNKILKLIEQHSGKLIESPAPLTRHNVSNIGNGYRWYYNDESIELVREYFKKDIEEFGYEY
jgi:hypothetical protein